MKDSAKTFEKLVSKFVATASGVPLAPLYLKTLEVGMSTALNKSERDSESFMRSTLDIKGQYIYIY